MLKKDPTERIDAPTAVSHPFFEEADVDLGKPSERDVLADHNQEQFERDPMIGYNIETLLIQMNLMEQI